jgi:hypothetical protein
VILPAQRAVVTVKKTKSGIKKTGSVSKKKSEIESTSYRGKEKEVRTNAYNQRGYC